MAKSIEVTLELNNKQFNRALKQSKTDVSGFEKTSVSSFGKIGAALAAIGTGQALSGIISTGSAFQDLRNSLNVVFGSVEEGAQQFERVQDFAQGTQFSVQTLTGAFVQLQGAGVEPTNRLLQIFADTASVTTDQVGTFQAALDLVSRSTAGGLGLEDLNRLADRGIPVFTMLNDTLGLSRLEISEFGKTAEGAALIIDALTQSLEARFSGALETSAGNISRLSNNLGDAFDKLQDSIFAPLSEDLAAGISGLTGLVDGLATAIKRLSDEGVTLMDLLMKLGGVLLFIFNPFTKIRLGITAAATAFKKFGLNVRNQFVHLGKAKDLISAMVNIFERLLSVVGGFLIVKFFQSFGEEVEKTGDKVEKETKKVEVNTKELMERKRAIELAVIQEKAFQKGLKSVTSAVREQTSAFDKNDPLSNYQEFLSSILETSNRMAVEQVFAARAVNTLREFLDAGLISTRAFNIAIERLNSTMGITPFEDFKDSLEGLSLTTEEYNEFQRQLNALIEKYPEMAEKASSAQDALNEALMKDEAMANFLDTLGQAQKALSEDLATAFLEGQSAGAAFQDFFKKMVKQILADILRLQIIQPILGSLFGLSFGAGGSVTGFDFGSSIFGGGKANGGPVMKNRPYIVGEQGPELFMPTAAGSIMPNGAMGGGQVTYNINAVDARSFKELVASDPEYLYNVTQVGARRQPR